MTNYKVASQVARGLLTLSLAATVLSACGSSDEDAADQGDANGGGQVTVYTGRHYGIEEVFEQFTTDTGIEVRFTTGKDPELRERLVEEGANTPADLLMTADAANVELAAEAGVLKEIDSPALEAAIPASLRSADNNWFGLSRRARVVVASTERVDDPPTTYEEVGDPKWKGRLCLRPSTHPYTQSLVASLIIANGNAAATETVASWVANDPLYIDSDTDIYEAIAAGDCDVALANTYYLGRLLEEDPEFPAAFSWPNQDERGAHVNLSTAAVTANGPNQKGAQRLLEWLATDGQQAFSDANFEYPADPSVDPAEIVGSWGTFKSDLDAILQLGEFQPDAVKVLSATGYE